MTLLLSYYVELECDIIIEFLKLESDIIIVTKIRKWYQCWVSDIIFELLELESDIIDEFQN